MLALASSYGAMRLEQFRLSHPVAGLTTTEQSVNVKSRQHKHAVSISTAFERELIVTVRLARQGRTDHEALVLHEDWRLQCEAADIVRN